MPHNKPKKGKPYNKEDMRKAIAEILNVIDKKQKI